MEEPKVFAKMTPEETASFKNFLKGQKDGLQQLKYDPTTDTFHFLRSGGKISRSNLEELSNTNINPQNIEL